MLLIVIGSDISDTDAIEGEPTEIEEFLVGIPDVSCWRAGGRQLIRSGLKSIYRNTRQPETTKKIRTEE